MSTAFAVVRPKEPFSSSNQIQRLKAAKKILKIQGVLVFAENDKTKLSGVDGIMGTPPTLWEMAAITSLYEDRKLSPPRAPPMNAAEDAQSAHQAERLIYNRAMKAKAEKLAMLATQILITTCLIEEQDGSLGDEEDPSKVYEKLQNFFFKRGNFAAVQAADAALTKAIKNLSLAKKDITKYLDAVLAANNTACAADEEKNGALRSHGLLVQRILDALEGKVYSNKITIFMSKENVGWDDLRSTLMTAERKKRDGEADSSGDSDLEPEEKKSALIAKAYKEGMAQGLALLTSSAGFKSRSNEKCAGCHKSGHVADRCWKLHPELKPEWATKRRAGTNKV